VVLVVNVVLEDVPEQRRCRRLFTSWDSGGQSPFVSADCHVSDSGRYGEAEEVVTS
jgi:hypothetical protein